jgi:hypothetical protein
MHLYLRLGECHMSLSVDLVSRPGLPTDSRLSVQPLIDLSDLSFARGVLSFGPIREGPAASTNGHPSVRLWEMMLVE